MQIGKVNNIISIDSYLKTREQKESQQSSLQQKPQEYKDNIITLDYISAYSGNIIINKKIVELMNYLKKAGLLVDYETAKTILSNYCNDFSRMAEVPKIAINFYDELIQVFKKTDFNGLDKAKSILGYGPQTVEEKELCDDCNIDPLTIVTNEQYKIISGLISDYVDILNEKTPYKFEIIKDRDGLCSQVEVSKDGFVISLSGMHFYDMVQNKNKVGDNMIILPYEDNDRYMYIYMTQNEVVYKTERQIGKTVGAICVEDINQDGTPRYLLDENLEFGLGYYALVETQKLQSETEMQEEDYRTSQEIIEQNAEINQAINLIRNCYEARAYFEEGYNPIFLASCVRDGKFNQDVFNAKDRLMTLIEESVDENIELNNKLIDQIFYLIEKEDNTFDMDAVDIIGSFIVKSILTNEDYSKFLYTLAEYIKNGIPKKETDVLISISMDEKIGYKETVELFNMFQLLLIGEVQFHRKLLEDLAHAKQGEFSSYRESLEHFKNHFSKFYEKY